MLKKEPTIRLAHPQVGETIWPTLREILDSGRLTQGPHRDRFEAALAAAHDVARAVTFNSATTALFALLRALNVSAGDRVIVPDFGFVATANVVELLGARCVFADVDADDCGLSPAWLETHAPSDVRAVVVVHQFGVPAKLAAIQAWADRHGARVIEDSACALGTRVGERPLGATSGIGVLSFHPRKIVAVGEGGALLTDDPILADRAAALSNHGLGLDGRITTPGLNLRLPEIACALGAEQLRRVPEIVAARVEIGKAYVARLADQTLVALPGLAGEPSWNHQTFFVTLSETIDRDRVLAFLRAENIECNIPARSLSAHEYYQERYAIPPTQVPVSRCLERQAVGLPCHEQLSEIDVQRVCDVLLRAIDVATIGR